MINLPLEEYAPYRILALFILVMFYSIYLAKAWLQKRQGIQTHQIGKGKERRVQMVETVMGIVTVSIIPVQLLSIIFGWSHLPANLGFDLQYIGILLLYFNLLTLIFTMFAVIMLHLQILQEEQYLTATFGEEYQAYRRQVFRYLGRRKQGEYLEC